MCYNSKIKNKKRERKNVEKKLCRIKIIEFKLVDLGLELSPFELLCGIGGVSGIANLCQFLKKWYVFFLFRFSSE